MDAPTAEELRTMMTVLDVASVAPVEVAPGIRRFTLTESEHARAWLLEFDPGTAWPEVDHHPTEERYYVLAGEFIEGEQRHPAGTYVTFAPGSRHRPRTETGGRMLGINLAR